MKLNKLYIDDFMCHEFSYVDFSEFNSALIVGKVENNELYSNGVGKTTIFKAIEYVLFNQSDSNLDKIIRDEANSCRIVLDFLIKEQEYRLVRSRNKKGTSDLSLYERNGSDDCDDTYHNISVTEYGNRYVPLFDNKYWKDISGRRSADTEKDLSKLLKINFKSFRSTVHFMQNDFSGLTTSTPEKRKGILKEALNLAVYSKLEKLTKDKSALLSKDIEKSKTLLENIGNPLSDLDNLNKELADKEQNISDKNLILSNLNIELSSNNDLLNDLVSKHSSIESKFSGLIQQKNSLHTEKSKIENNIEDYSVKKNNIIKTANEIISSVKSLKEEKVKLEEINFSQIDLINEEIIKVNNSISEGSSQIAINLSKIEELKIPLPSDNSCKHCRQPLSENHRIACQDQIDSEMAKCKNNILNLKKVIENYNSQKDKFQRKLNTLNESKKKLDNIILDISSKEKEISDKKEIHNEYVSIISSLKNDLKLKNEEIDKVEEQLKSSSQEEANEVKILIDKQKEIIKDLNAKIFLVSKDLSHLNAGKAVIEHNINQKKVDLDKKENLKQTLSVLEDKFSIYPHILQAFSSTGIPNLIIQNVLDDLQLEANNLLSQLKPGLQLSFFVEKTKSDGTEADTLDINYQINGKDRDYDQLSGAQKLAVTFSLKLGLSFLLQKMIGTDIKFLMLDEIDQSLDKASVDSFADIVKFFQKDFTILVITHNDRLKDKFNHAICVEQDINMVSRAKVVSSW